MEELIRSEATLPGLPLELLEQISKDTDCKAIFSLRKVCKLLRTKSLAIKPGIPAKRIIFTVNSEGIELFIDSDTSSCEICSNHESDQPKNNLKNFFNDVSLVLDHVKSVVWVLWLRLSETDDGSMNLDLVKHLGEYLASRQRKLEVRDFQSNNFEKVFPILSNLHETAIDGIRFRIFENFVEKTIKEGEELRWIDIEQIQKLPIWKNARAIVVKDFWIKNSIMNFKHFDSVDCNFKTASVQELVFMKNMFVRNPNRTELRSYAIRLSEPPHGIGLERALGQFNLHKESKEWCYWTIYQGRVARLRLSEPIIKFEFWRTFRGNISEDAIVQ